MTLFTSVFVHTYVKRRGRIVCGVKQTHRLFYYNIAEVLLHGGRSVLPAYYWRMAMESLTAPASGAYTCCILLCGMAGAVRVQQDAAEW